MKPTLGKLSPGQQRLWPELSDTPREFTLFGGIALSIRFEHRHTADFDFFTRSEFDPEELYSKVSYLKGSEVLQISPNTLVCSADRGEPVKLSFFGLPAFGRVCEPEVVEGVGIQVSSLLELAGTKASVIQKRAMARDYIDLDLLLGRGGVDLAEALVAGRTLYGRLFNPHIALKALTYFGDGDLTTLPRDICERLSGAAQSVDLEALASRIAGLS